VSYERTAEFLSEAFGIQISEAALQSFNLGIASRLEKFETDIKERLLNEPILHADESGMRIEGKLNWVHSIGSKRFTLYFPNKKRGGEAMKAMGVLPNYTGTLIHDG
jgi:transposase